MTSDQFFAEQNVFEFEDPTFETNLEEGWMYGVVRDFDELLLSKDIKKVFPLLSEEAQQTIREFVLDKYM